MENYNELYNAVEHAKIALGVAESGDILPAIYALMDRIEELEDKLMALGEPVLPSQPRLELDDLLDKEENEA